MFYFQKLYNLIYKLFTTYLRKSLSISALIIFKYITNLVFYFQKKYRNSQIGKLFTIIFKIRKYIINILENCTNIGLLCTYYFTMY